MDHANRKAREHVRMLRNRMAGVRRTACNRALGSLVADTRGFERFESLRFHFGFSDRIG